MGQKVATGTGRATFAILKERPEFPMVGAEAARQIRRLIDAGSIRRLEDGPVGGTAIYFGNDAIGQVLDAPLPAYGGWYLSRIIDMSLAQSAYQLATQHRIWLPTMHESAAFPVPMTTVARIGSIGPYHSDIEGNNSSGGIRGPFKIHNVSPGSAPTYPVLWSHDAERERQMVFEADCDGIPLKGKTQKDQAVINLKVDEVWRTASHCHLNRDFRFNSQSTCMQFSTRKTIGGHAWPSISLDTVEQEKALVAWGNTTFGLLMYWWHANKQQTGRGRTGVKAAAALPILDVKNLSPKRLRRAVKIFDVLAMKALLPLNEIDTDPVRRKLDAAFGRYVLGLDKSILAPGGPLELMRMKLAREPSIHRGKMSKVGFAEA